MAGKPRRQQRGVIRQLSTMSYRQPFTRDRCVSVSVAILALGIITLRFVETGQPGPCSQMPAVSS